MKVFQCRMILKKMKSLKKECSEALLENTIEKYDSVLEKSRKIFYEIKEIKLCKIAREKICERRDVIEGLEKAIQKVIIILLLIFSRLKLRRKKLKDY